MPKKVCVRSSINIDECDDGPEFFELEHIVQSGETISSTAYSRRPGGKGANCATAIAKASSYHTVDFCGTINAQDTFLRDTLASYGVGASVDSLKTSETVRLEPTGRAIIQVSTKTADNSIILLPGCNYASYDLPHDLREKYSHLLVQNEIPIEQTCEALAAAKEAGLVTIFNPSPIPSREIAQKIVPWESVDWLVVNQDEAENLAHLLTTADDGDALSRLCAHFSRATAIIITKGADGVEAALSDESGAFHRLSAPSGRPVDKIIDTTGAGDTFTGYLVASLLELEQRKPVVAELQVILGVASEAATACCEKHGAMEAIPSLELVLERLARPH